MSARLLDINMRRAERAKLIEIPSRLWVPDFLWQVAVFVGNVSAMHWVLAWISPWEELYGVCGEL